MGCFQDMVSGFAKYILFGFNLLILVAAAIFIGMAVKFRQNNYGLDMSTATLFPIVLGVIIALIAFFGCCGAIKENSCMLTSYATVMIIFFIIQLVLGILALVAIKKNGNDKYVILHDELEDIYKKSADPEKRKVIDELQKGLKCCGFNNSNDPYVRNGTGNGLFPSCCENLPCTVENAYHEGCYDKLADNLVTILKGIGIVAIIFGAIELLAAIFACCVKNSN